MIHTSIPVGSSNVNLKACQIGHRLLMDIVPALTSIRFQSLFNLQKGLIHLRDTHKTSHPRVAPPYRGQYIILRVLDLLGTNIVVVVRVEVPDNHVVSQVVHRLPAPIIAADVRRSHVCWVSPDCWRRED